MNEDAVEDWVAIYSGSPEGAQALAARLESVGVQSYISAEPGPMSSAGGYRDWRATLLVPPESEAEVRNQLSSWEATDAAATAQLGRTLARVAALGLVPLGVWLGLSALGTPGVPPPRTHWLLALYATSVVVLAQIAHRRNRREHVRYPTS